MDQLTALQQLLAHMQANGGGRQDARDNSAEMQRLALEQAARMRQPHLRQNVVPGGGSMANTGDPYAGMQGAQSGPSDPFAQVPGMGSTANALPYANALVDSKQRNEQLADDAYKASMLGYGTALGTMFAPPNPLTLAMALGGLGMGAIGGFTQANARERARQQTFQGN